MGIKRPLAGGAGAGAGAGASPTVQTPDFRSLFQTGARAESGLHLATAPGDINDHFPFLVGPDAARGAGPLAPGPGLIAVKPLSSLGLNWG